MKPLLIIGIVAIVAAILAAVVFLVLPNMTVTTSASYLLNYQGYTFAKAAGVTSDGRPSLEAIDGTSFSPGEDVYIVIYGIGGFKTEGGMAKLNLQMSARGLQGQGDVTPGIGQDMEYPAQGGYIDNAYGFLKGDKLRPGKYSVALTLKDLLGGGSVSVNAEFIVG